MSDLIGNPKAGFLWSQLKSCHLSMIMFVQEMLTSVGNDPIVEFNGTIMSHDTSTPVF